MTRQQGLRLGLSGDCDQHERGGADKRSQSGYEGSSSFHVFILSFFRLIILSSDFKRSGSWQHCMTLSHGILTHNECFV